MEFRSRSRLQLLAALLAIGLGLWFFWQAFTGPAAAQTSPAPSVNDLQQWQQLVEEYRTGVSKQRQQLEQLEGAAREHLEGLQNNIATTSAQIATNEAQLAETTQQLQQLQAKYAVADGAYQERRTMTVARLQFLQRQRPSQTWTVLLQSQNLNQLLDRRQRLKRVYQADQQLLSNLKTQADQLQAQKAQIELKKNQISLLTQQLAAEKSEYEAQAKTQEQLVGRLTSDRQALEAAEVQLAQDSQNLSLLIQQRLLQRQQRSAPGGIVAYGTGRMGFPTNGPITSNFGLRVHPILGTERFHAGTDFGAPEGTPIHASDRGVVLFAGWYGGYGNTVILDHGNGLTSLYGHASELYVQEGQAVQRGQAIATVGSTGLSTGPHLHFEIRQNGEPVDPLAFL